MPTFEKASEVTVSDKEKKEFALRTKPGAAFLERARDMLDETKQRLRSLLKADLPLEEEKKFTEIENKYQQLLNQESFFASHPEAELEAWRQQEFMSDAEVDERLQYLAEQNGPSAEEDEAKKLLGEIIEAVDEETEFVTNLSVTVKKDNLLNGLAGGKYELPVKFGIDGIPDGAAVNSGLGIYMGGQAPTTLDLVGQLAKQGGQAPHIQALHHELVHALDGSDKMTVGRAWKLDMILAAAGASSAVAGIIFRGTIPSEVIIGGAVFGAGALTKFFKDIKDPERENQLLTETHAYLSNRRLGLNIGTPEMVQHFKKYYGLRSAADVDRVFSASQAIQSLYVLGLDDRQIGEIVNQSKWDKEKKIWPLLEERVATLMSEKNVAPAELDDFIKRQGMRAEIDHLKVRKIAQEKIRQVTSEMPVS